LDKLPEISINEWREKLAKKGKEDLTRIVPSINFRLSIQADELLDRSQTASQCMQ